MRVVTIHRDKVLGIRNALLLLSCFLLLSIYLCGADIEIASSDSGYTETPFIFEHLGLGPVIDLSSSLAKPEDSHYRTHDVRHAGYYYIPPEVEPMKTVDSSDIGFIENNVQKYLASEYFDGRIFTMVQNYYILLILILF